MHIRAELQAITVEVYEGVVQLSAFVDSDNVRAKATKAAKGGAGHALVQNQLEMKQTL